MTERFAIYFAPASTSPLWGCALRWFERPELAAMTTSARRYGFHATLKAPMRLAAGHCRADLETAIASLARDLAPVPLGHLVPQPIEGFVALVPERQVPALADLAARVVTSLDRFRAPLGDIERERRLSAGLSPRQVDLLERYGYPYVLEEFRFHMTLTDRLSAEQQRTRIEDAHAWFGEALRAPVTLDRLVLFHEPAPGAPFARAGDHLLTGVTA